MGVIYIPGPHIRAMIRAASIYSQVSLLLAYIVCLLVSVRVCANDCINNIMINRNASRYVSIIYAEKWLLRAFFDACLRAWCPLYIKIFVLSVFYSCRYTIAPLLCLSSFVCAHSYIFQLFIYSEYNYPPTILTSLPPPPFPVWSIGGCTPPNFLFFSKFQLVFPLLSS